jgi:hypothetical protein
MTPEDFTRLLHTYGTDLRRWPEEDREGAQFLRDHSTAGRQEWIAAETLEALFRMDRDHISGSARNAAIVNAALRQIRSSTERLFDWRRFLSKRWAAAATATVVAGWLAGVVLGSALVPSPNHGVSAVAVLLGDETAGMDDFL